MKTILHLENETKKLGLPVEFRPLVMITLYYLLVIEQTKMQHRKEIILDILIVQKNFFFFLNFWQITK